MIRDIQSAGGLKFDSREIVAALGAVEDGECRVLKITGNFFDGTPIKGEGELHSASFKNPLAYL